MTEKKDSSNIHTAILAIMQSVGYVQKEKAKDSKISYSLKTENAVLDALRPAMLENGVVMYPVSVKDVAHSSFEVGQYHTVWNRIVATHVYRFYHVPSDTYQDVEIFGDGADPGDKAGNKSMTVSKKYALLETFLLLTGDDPDETSSPQDTKRAGTGKNQPQSNDGTKVDMDIITDEAWGKWQALVKQATDIGVKVNPVQRNKSTRSDLLKRYHEVEALIKQANEKVGG